jgi:hypothetical protein
MGNPESLVEDEHVMPAVQDIADHRCSAPARPDDTEAHQSLSATAGLRRPYRPPIMPPSTLVVRALIMETVTEINTEYLY